jgi:phage tail-like protein
MGNLRDLIFRLFGPAEKLADTTNRDAEGRGLNERFMRALGAEFDDSLYPLLDGFVANCVDPTTALARFVPYLEQQMGVAYQVSDSLSVRRKLIAWAPRITRLKGTKRSYEILLKLMGFATVNLIEHFVGHGFDSAITLDDPDRRFDSRCAGCTDYSLELTGTLTMTPEIIAWIRSVVSFCEPINARLRLITYNTFIVPYGTLIVATNADGDLLYDNSGAPDTSLRLLPNGDLEVRGRDAGRYSLSPQGDLLYN